MTSGLCPSSLRTTTLLFEGVMTTHQLTSTHCTVSSLPRKLFNYNIITIFIFIYLFLGRHIAIRGILYYIFRGKYTIYKTFVFTLYTDKRYCHVSKWYTHNKVHKYIIHRGEEKQRGSTRFDPASQSRAPRLTRCKGAAR